MVDKGTNVVYLDYNRPSGEVLGYGGTTGAKNMAEEAPLTISVPEAGRRYFSMSRNASYQAAERGDIPTVRIGRLLRVPVAAMDRMLEAAKPRATA